MENENQNNAAPALRHPALLLTVAGSAALLADALLFGQGAGIGWALFLLVLPGALLLLGAGEARRPRWSRLLTLLIPYGFFAVMLAMHADPALAALNFAACFVLLGLIARLYAGGSLTDLGFGPLASATFRLLGAASWSASPLAGRVLAGVRAQGGVKKSGLGVARGLLLALPALVVLIPLLAAADPRFGQLLERAAGSLIPRDFGERVGRGILTLGAAWCLAGGLAWTLSRCAGAPKTFRSDDRNPLGFVEGVTVLGVVALVFGAFLGLQASYLFGGQDWVRKVPGLTCAEYARSGFGELVAVAALAAALIEGLRAFVRRESVLQSRIFAALSTALVGMTLTMLASAWQRMAAYEASFGSTSTRIWVDAFIVWLGMVLLWLAATLWRASLSRRFAFGCLICALGFGATVNVFPPERVAAARNLARPNGFKDVRFSGEETADLTLIALRKTPLQGGYDWHAERLLDCLKDARTGAWPSWNLSRARILHALAPAEAELRARIAETDRLAREQEARRVRAAEASEAAKAKR